MTPATESELAEAIKSADGPLRVIGGGTRPVGRAAPGEALSTTALTGVTLYEPGALTLVVQAGTPLADVEATLAAENQRLAFEPMDHRALLGTSGTPTIGGVVAANVSGPRRIAVGACRDFLLGVRFVDGAGRVIKNGGRVMKNVTGYDLVKLMAGSYGTLGVLSEVALKVLPQSETEATLMLPVGSVDAAVGAMSAALGSAYEVTGAAFDGHDVLLRIEGFEGSVAYRQDALSGHLSAHGAITVISDAAESAGRWRAIRDVETLQNATGDLWRISVRPSAAPKIADELPKRSQMLLDWGGGLIWVAVPSGTDVRAVVTGGHATLVRGDASVPTFHPEPAPLAKISADLRATFDPKGLLNSGVMG